MSEEENASSDATPPPAPEPTPPADSTNPTPPASGTGADKKLVAGLLGILLGWLGIHKFYLGYQKEGIIMCVVGVVGFALCGIPTSIVGIIGLIEGILYLTKSDEEFVATYVNGNKPWF